MKKLFIFFFIYLTFFKSVYAWEQVENLAGTTWVFIPIPKDERSSTFEIKFFDNGNCKYLREGKEEGTQCYFYVGYKNKLHLILNQFSIRTGTIYSDKVEGKAINLDGERWRFKGIKIKSNYN